MDAPEQPQPKKVITLFGKKINVQSSDKDKDKEEKEKDTTPAIPSPTPSNPASPISLELNENDTPQQLQNSTTVIESPEIQVLKLRLHLMEQKVKQLTDNNERLNAQLNKQLDICADLEYEKTLLSTELTKEKELVQAAEKENEMLQYKLGVYEKLQPSLSYPAPPVDWYARGGDRERERERERDRGNSRDSRDSRDRDRGDSRDREDSRERDRDRYAQDERWREQYNHDHPRPYSPQQSPPYDTSFGLHLPSLSPTHSHSHSLSHSPSPPHPHLPHLPPAPRQNVFSRLGDSSSELLPSLPDSSPYDENGNEYEDGDVEEEGIIEDSEERKKDLEARLNMPLDALTKSTKSVQKANKKLKKRPLCKYYKQSGSCKNKKCKFSHSEPTNKRAKIDV